MKKPRPYDRMKRDAFSEIEGRIREALKTGDRRWFRLSLPKTVPWWIRWRPSVRRWLRETERSVNDYIQNRWKP